MLNFSHHLPETELIKGRHPLIIDRCRNKKVLHIGCVDSGLLAERYKSGELLHKKLDESAAILFGIDIDKNGIDTLISCGYSNLYHFNLIEDDVPETLMDETFDIIVLSEVIEHLSNPGIMLERLKQFMKPGHTQLIVSVPNAFSVKNMISMARNIEHVHPDHNCYFSFITFKNTLEKSGLSPFESFVYIFETDLLPRKIHDKILKFDQIKKQKSRPASFPKRFLWRARQLGFWQSITEFPTALLSSILLRRSSFWGDGLLSICILKIDSDATSKSIK